MHTGNVLPHFGVIVSSFVYDLIVLILKKQLKTFYDAHGVHFTICSPGLEDSSEQVKKELARSIGQLSCIQSELSQLSDTHTESTRLPEILCHQLSLAAEHAGNTFPSLRATVVRPFLTLLRQEAPSSVKQGILGVFICCFLQ